MACSRVQKLVTQKLSISGVIPPVITPFTASGEIDFEKYEFNIKKYEKETKFQGYVVGGSYSEVGTLSPAERIDLISRVRKWISSDKILIGGATSESTKGAVEMSKEMQKVGADALLVLTPHYFKKFMTDDAVYNHFTTLANESPIPLVIYNNEIVSGIDVSISALTKLADHPNIIAVKDSDVRKIALTVQNTKGKNFNVLSAFAGYFLPALQMGSTGGIMGLAAVLGNETIQLYSLVQDKKWDEATELQKKLIHIELAVLGAFGVPGLKAAMELKGFQSGYLRSPLQKLSEERINEIKEVLKKYDYL